MFDETRTATQSIHPRETPPRLGVMVIAHPDPRLLGMVRLPVEDEELLLGQGSNALVPGALDDARFSRRHACITGTKDGLQVTDLDSRNGTLFNGELITDPNALAAYDIVFLNCGINDMWHQNAGQINNALNQYVASGGSIYASDWAFSNIETSFADRIDFLGNDRHQWAVTVGREGSIDADVIDEDMQSVLGSSVAKLNHDLGNLSVIADANADILIKGDTATYGAGKQEDVPLAVQFDQGGRVIYTTFHNENQLTVDMELLLREIILTL